MSVHGLTVDSKTSTPVVVLLELGGERKLPIWIGPSEASAIAMRLHDVELARPLTHDLAHSLVLALGGRITTVRIHGIEDGTYRADVVLERDGAVVAVDARPSDAIAIALRAQAEIQVADHLFRPLEPPTTEPPDPP